MGRIESRRDRRDHQGLEGQRGNRKRAGQHLVERPDLPLYRGGLIGGGLQAGLGQLVLLGLLGCLTPVRRGQVTLAGRKTPELSQSCHTPDLYSDSY